MQTPREQAVDPDNSTDTDNQRQIQANAGVATRLHEHATRAIRAIRKRVAAATHPGARGQPPEIDEEIDDVATVIKNARRRLVIRAVALKRGEIPIGELADLCTQYEQGTPEFTCQERKRAYVALYQTHLDTLDDADVINYDKNRGVVTPGPRLDAYDDALKLLSTACRETEGGDE